MGRLPVPRMGVYCWQRQRNGVQWSSVECSLSGWSSSCSSLNHLTQCLVQASPSEKTEHNNSMGWGCRVPLELHCPLQAKEIF